MKRFSTHNAFLKGAQGAEWLYQADVQGLLAALAEPGDEARIVGGAVRDTLLQRPVSDIDIAATALPEQVMERAARHGFHAVPLGIEFGTVLLVGKQRRFQVTTLRADMATDGRHARVAFCRDWQQDAARRDFTVNALYVDKNGRLYDYTGGLADLENGIVRFIGDAAERIKEDYLRILRFFRFYALLGRGRPDRQAIMAVAALKEGLGQLAAERIWDELKKLLAAPAPYRSLLWLRSCGALDLILPESSKWGLDILPGLIADEPAAAKGGPATAQPDSMLRLMALIPPQPERVASLAKRLRLSGQEKRRLESWAAGAPIAPAISEAGLRQRLYLAGRGPIAGKRQNSGHSRRGAALPPGRQAVLDTLRLARAAAAVYRKPEDYQRYTKLLTLAENEEEPRFPLSGADIAAAGLRGAAIGRALQRLEALWLQSGFRLDKQALLARLQDNQP